MRRFLLLIAMALAALGLATGSAWACTDPGISIGASEVHPGDTVTYNIAPLGPGAVITVRVGDVTVDGPLKAEDGSVTRSFRMPDMGSVNRVSIEATVEHGDIENPDQTLNPSVPGSVAYSASRPSSQPPAPDSSSTSDQSPPPGDVAPAAAPVDPANELGATTSSPPTGPGPGLAAQPSPARGGGGSTGTTRSSPKATHRSVVGKHRPAAGRTLVPALVAPAAGTPVAAESPAPVLSRTARHPVDGIAPVRESRPARRGAQDRSPVPGGVSVRPREAPGAPAAAPSNPQRGVALPIGLAIALLIAAAGWMRRRGLAVLARGRPTPSTDPSPRAVASLRDAEIEAELQEMLAEESARRDRTIASVP